ncbi:hypothetical protein CY34DRAFT_81233 [Suillus luteus UH-Slu-Lm8-n1]|uniref:WD40 repeat-like protein n=1 Tax=Suillus luteus UH-Slu-Lm8-n1 TaxID=930992 RepID=A0A0D0APK7_9AGAM|nr:hypothetical protein CY34DRAFT_81233 [Suillus luteus UH-Slu-Lm8-n1]
MTGQILHLPDGKQIIIYSLNGSFRVWDLRSGTQVGDEWEDNDLWLTMALSPDGKIIASGSLDGAVRLWNIYTGKVIIALTGHEEAVRTVCWSPNGGRVVSGYLDGTFRVWNVETGKTILGPIHAGSHIIRVVCYSPNAKMIATGGAALRIWDANTGELLKTLEGVFSMCLAWTSDSKTLVAGGSKIDTATWTVLELCNDYVNAISLFPNERIFASTSFINKTAQLWNFKTNTPIGTPLHRYQHNVRSATFSTDGKFLVTCCDDSHIYTWDVSTIIKDAGLPSDLVSIDILLGH